MDNSASTQLSRRRLLTSLGILSSATAFAGGGVLKQKEDTQTSNFSLKGKSAIVTGAARGIGRAIAVALAKAGADIMAIDIAEQVSAVVPYKAATQADLEETGRLVKAESRKFIGVKADTRDASALKAAADRALKEFGKIDILVANAAIQTYSPVAQMSDGQWKDIIEVNEWNIQFS